MMLIEFLERLLSRPDDTSRQKVKNRLKFVLAHDRADLTPDLVESIRKEILEVLSRYVELDREHMEFSLESDNRTTALIANLPIRRVLKPMEGVEEAPIESVTSLEPLTLDADSSDTPNSSPDQAPETSAELKDPELAPEEPSPELADLDGIVLDVIDQSQVEATATEAEAGQGETMESTTEGLHATDLSDQTNAENPASP